ncbi:glycine betaine ABC transporter substrate-binding protein [Paenibacillus tundrae]|uniref:Glycine betaine/proline transport system substrate-binding protein n=1 Tax=Paenibacillus tundrae TaxID=528187 RepID=A0ABT9WKC1_9BACL|nr:glycine betaine ABC transporter substrate-binding protein [Paenibacillus tundrae]MDQ0173509.1 glycine betaine/proline transport system substrate-binding protein [Paenibacillus tundrae]
MRKVRKWMLFTSLAAIFVLAACSSNAATGENKPSVGKQVNYKITGSDPGSGLMRLTAQAMEDYDLSNWTLMESSAAGMTAQLDRAYKNKEPIVFVAWSPHWMFNTYDLKYLDDPKLTYGEPEEIHTIARLGLKKDHPVAYEFLDRFNWTSDDMGEVMVDIQDGMEPEEAAAKWVNGHEGKVQEWIEGLTPVKGDSFILSYVAWDSELASTNVVRYVLEEKLGYRAKALQVEIGPMWLGVANGDVDAIVAAWLPVTHSDYWEQYGERLDDLGANMVNVKSGLAVPSYMEDVNSIEDLQL